MLQVDSCQLLEPVKRGSFVVDSAMLGGRVADGRLPERIPQGILSLNSRDAETGKAVSKSGCSISTLLLYQGESQIWCTHRCGAAQPGERKHFEHPHSHCHQIIKSKKTGLNKSQSWSWYRSNGPPSTARSHSDSRSGQCAIHAHVPM